MTSHDSDPELELINHVMIACPYCGEGLDIAVDPGGGVRQDYTQDCEVCCQPYRLTLRFERGWPAATVERDDGS